MNLHEFPEEYNELVSLVAREKHISESAVKRDCVRSVVKYIESINCQRGCVCELYSHE